MLLYVTHAAPYLTLPYATHAAPNLTLPYASLRNSNHLEFPLSYR